MDDDAKAVSYSDPDLPVGRREAMRRVNRAMDYIDAHLAEPIRLKQLAAQAHFSPYHFVRVFTAITGETPASHLRRLRLARAALLLYGWPNASILEIALATGFQSAPVFARAFRLEFGMSASAWRRADFWHPCGVFRCWRPLPCRECEGRDRLFVDADRAEIKNIPPRETPKPTGLGEIKIENLPPRRVAYMRGVGPLAGNYATVWRRLTRWLIVRDLAGPDAVLFVHVLDSPHITAPRHLRYDAGLVIDDSFVPDRYVNTREVPGGWFVTAPFTGPIAEELIAGRYLYSVWLPAHGYMRAGQTYHICVPRRDNMALSQAHIDNVFNCTFYLPILPPK